MTGGRHELRAMCTARVSNWHFSEVPVSVHDVCLSGKTGSNRRRLKTTRLTHAGHRRPKSATGTPAGLRNFGVIPGVMNWVVLRDFAFGSTHICRLSSQTAASQEAL